jgi:hypothetical protein
MQNRFSIALAARSADAAVSGLPTGAAPTVMQPDLRILILDSSRDKAGFKFEPKVLHEKI